MMKFEIKGQPITKKNSQQIIKCGGRYMLIPSKQYRAYEEMALKQLPKVFYNCPINIKCVYYMPTRRRVDLTNLLEATDDVLVKGEVIADDNCTIIVSHDGSCVKYSKDNPRVEITIEEKEWTIWEEE